MNKPETAQQSKKNLKKFKYGSMSLIVLVLVVVIVVILNIMTGYISKRAPLKLDLTADNRYELSDETIDYLKNKLDKDVEIVVTCPRDDFQKIASNAEFTYLYYYGVKVDCPYDMIPVLLEKYEMYANQGKGKVKVKYVDLDKDPKAIQKYRDIYGSEINAQSMIISSNDRVRVIEPSGVGAMITPDQSNKTTISMVFAGESTITSEIMNVTDAHPIRVAFASKYNGASIYNENAYSTPVQGLRDTLLNKNGYFCTDIDLVNDELSTEKYDMVVVPMPSKDFDEAIIEKLSKFLHNDGTYGKDMMFVSDYLTTNLPNITEFLESWNIKPVQGKVIADEEKFMSNNPFALQAKAADNDAVGSVNEGSLRLVALYSQEVELLTKNNGVITNPVIQTHDTAYSVDMTTEEREKNTKVKNIAVIARKEAQISNTEVGKSHVLAVGCAFLTDPTILAQTNLYSNSNVLLSVINTMTGKETDTVVIPDKALQQAVIAQTAKQDKAIKTIVIFIIPAIVAVIGLAVLIRRRNR